MYIYIYVCKYIYLWCAATNYCLASPFPCCILMMFHNVLVVINVYYTPTIQFFFVESDTINGLYTLGNQAVTAYYDWFLSNSFTLNKKYNTTCDFS